MANRLQGVVSAQTHAASAGPETSSIKRLVRSSQRPNDALWSFSFRHWRQQEFFGLAGPKVGNEWLVSVIERLHSLSNEKIERFLSDVVLRQAMRFHPIDWAAKNIPIVSGDLSLPSEYPGNPEFALHQFQVSTGKGRIVGFFDERWIFNVVLFDPLHNLQPSKAYDYKVDPCSPLNCELTKLREGIKRHIAPCENAGCSVVSSVAKLVHAQEDELEQFQILMVRVDDESTLATAKKLVTEGKAKSLVDIFETGVAHHME